MTWKIFRALVRAKLWLLWHWGYCLLVQYDNSSKLWPKIISIETGKGSVLSGTWETKLCYYIDAEFVMREIRESKP